MSKKKAPTDESSPAKGVYILDEDDISPDMLELKVTRRWVKLICKVQSDYYIGEICFSVCNGEPVKLYPKKSEQEIRFDKEERFPSPIIAPLDSFEDIQLHVSKNWIKFINWVRNNNPYGQVGVTIYNGDPVKKIKDLTWKEDRFDKDDTTPIDFTK
jgi:hypothetical protein